MSENATTCNNCETKIVSTFCPNCGQKTKIRPISWRGLFEEFYSTWLGMDNKFARTVKGLILHPTKVIESYLNGNRVTYIGPLSYLVVMSAIYILTFELTGVSPTEFLEATSEQIQKAPTEEKQLEFMQNNIQSISDNMRLMAGSIIPFLSLSMLVFYRKYNYLQNFLIATFMASELIWLNILSIVVFALFGLSIQLYLIIVSLVYMIWILAKLNPQKSRAWTWMKALLTWVVGYMIFMITIVIVGLGYFFLYVAES